MNDKQGMSKYAKKVKRRQAHAARLGLPKHFTYPQIWAAEREMRPISEARSKYLSKGSKVNTVV